MEPMHPKTSAILASLACLALAGCRVETNKNGSGDNVNVATPFGGMQVKTNDAVSTEGIGLPIYPGATPITRQHGNKDDGAADVNMSFGAFKMRIKAASFHSDDSPAKITAFYRTALAKYGDIIQCNHGNPVGTPTQTSQGLTCDNKKNNHLTVSGSGSGDLELKTGSQQHQHIVALDHDGQGTKIGLVALDLPGHLSIGDNDDDKQ